MFAPLLAGQTLEEANDLRTIWQSSITENSSLNPWVLDPTREVNGGSTQVNIGQVSSLEQRFTTNERSSQISPTEVSPIQRTGSQVSIAEVSSTQVSFRQNPIGYNSMTKVGTSEISLFQPSTTQVRTTEIGTAEIGSVQLSSKQDSTTQINPWQFSICQSGAIYLNSTEISLSSSITLQKFLNSHNLNLQNTTLPAWISFLQAPTPFNLNIEISDLPTGQLAEAQITKFDEQGRPISGSILIDDDANCKGWFIDSTPLDNSEFTNNLSDTAYRAAADSAAFGHYDLLTALLHEMGHLAGFIDGYKGFDSHVQTVNGSRLFITPDGISAKLSTDHLDPKLYPYDLFNPRPNSCCSSCSKAESLRYC